MSRALVEAPLLRPSTEEWQDPLAYVRSVLDVVQQYGVARIQPPPTWQPPFAIQSSALKLRPTTQRTSELLQCDVGALNFMSGLREFLDSMGTPLRKLPILAGRELDLYSLYTTVERLGGYHSITQDKRWAEVCARPARWRPRIRAACTMRPLRRAALPKLPVAVECGRVEVVPLPARRLRSRVLTV